MARRLEENRKELAILRGKRTPETLALWVKEFGEGDPALAARYELAVSRFLGGTVESEEWQSYLGKLSPNTRKAYSFAVTEFFEWIATKRGRVVPPHKVLREDAESYAQWLTNRPFTLEAEKLRDGDQTFRYAVYQAISSLDGSASLRQIEDVLVAWGRPELTKLGDKSPQRNWLRLELGRMVLHDELRRTPTLDELRRDYDPEIGINTHVVQFPPEHEGGIGPLVPLEDVFVYTMPIAKGVGRSTVALRFAALGAFWDALSLGENVKGAEEPLVRFNIFKDLRKRITRGLAAERKQATASKRMDPHLVPKLLAEVNRGRTLPDLRDRALVYFLVFAGARVSEAIQIRSGTPPPSEQHKWPGWYDASSDPPSVTIVRKGGKRMTLPMPPTALQMLTEFRAELKRLAAPDEAQSRDHRSENYISSDSPQWRYRELAFMPDAPLFPSVSHWGANSSVNYKPLRPNVADRGGTSYRKSFTRHGVSMMLRRLALRAGLSEREARSVHPHAFRHFAATAMAEGGKDLREIQALLGHESVTTTEGYLAQIEAPDRLSGQREITEYLAKLAPPPGAEPEAAGPVPQRPAAVRERPPPAVVETTGIARPERSHKPPRVPAPPPPEEEGSLSERHIAHAEAVLGRLEKQLGGYGWSDLGLLEIVAAKVDWDAERDRPARSADAEADVLLASGFDPRVEQEQAELAGEHTVPILPELPAPPLTVSHTSEGEVVHDDENHIIAVDGKEPPPGMTPAVITEMRDWQSPGSPRIEHERIEFTHANPREPGDKGATIYVRKVKDKDVEYVQANTKKHHLLATKYDPWPADYGIGTSSLLAWYARGSNVNDEGIVKGPGPGGKQVEIPPIPILAPAQVFPETSGSLLTALEEMHKNWAEGNEAAGITAEPARAYGLVRWFGAMAHMTAKLVQYRREAGEHEQLWQGWDELIVAGTAVRAHQDQWTLDWFTKNAHTYTTTVRAFEAVPRGKRAHVDDQEFFEAFETATAEGVSMVEEIPAWFALEDPVHELYERDPKEWDAFARWIANVTGQRLTRERETQRKNAKKFADKSLVEKREEVSDLLVLYYESVSRLAAIRELRSGSRDEELGRKHPDLFGESPKELAQSAKNERLSLSTLVAALQERGIPDPKESTDEVPHKITARIVAIVDKHIPTEAEAEDANMFAASDLFNAAYFRVDQKAHTLRIDDDARATFAARFDGRDAQVLMRRAARGMWEKAKRPGKKGKKKGVPLLGRAPDSDDYGLMYSVMLSYLAWVVPGPGEMEAQARAFGVKAGGDVARREWLRKQALAMRDLLYGESAAEHKELTEEQETALLVEKYDMSPEQVKVAMRQRDLSATISAEMEAWSVGEAAIREQLGEHGAMRVVAGPKPKKKKAEEEGAAPPAPVREGERVLRAGIHVRKKAGEMSANPSHVSVSFLQGEKLPTHFYAWRPPARKGMHPNPERVVLLSPGALASMRKVIAGADAALPSPFRMIAAMLA